MPSPPRQHRAFIEAMRGAWRRQARPEQIAPPGDWTTWVFCGGRGAGKTRSGAEWVQERVAAGARYIHLIGPTAADCRDVMLEGPAGILSIAAPHERPVFQPSLRKLVWPNGAQGLLFSGEEFDRLRGPQCSAAWLDELCAMRTAEDVLSNMYFGLRVGKDPRCLITTTPRPLKCFKALLARDGQDVIVTRSSSYANRDNLAPAFFAQVVAKYAGTRLGRQELEAELLTDTPGALWHLDRIEELRVRAAPQPFERVLVSIDPAVTHGPDSDETGIIVVALAADGCGYVLDDLSGRYPPEEWARRAIGAYRQYSADRIVGEVNQGGSLVEATLRSVDPAIPFTAVHASRGKLTRAEPVSALYEQGKVHHVGVFGPLEDQMTSYDGSRTGSSPDRLDALVWGLTELLLGEPPGRFLRPETLLSADSGGRFEPVEMPRTVENIFAVATITDDQPDTLGCVFFADTGTSPAVLILDWIAMPIEPATFHDFFAITHARLEELVELTGSKSSHAPLIIEQSGLGLMLLEQARARHYNAITLADEELVAKDLTARVIEAGSYVAAGSIKLARTAHEKASTLRGVTRNHLLAELGAFGLGDTGKAVGPLLACFSTGALNIVGGNSWKDVWLGLVEELAPGPLGAVREPAAPPPTAAPLTTWNGELHASRSNPVLAQRRAEHAARNEAERLRELADFQAREARMRAEGLL